TFFDGTCHGARGAGLLLAARLAAVVVNDDLRVRLLRTAAGREALRELAPRGDELLTTATTLRFALTTTVGVIDRVHHHTADGRADAEPATAAGLPERLVLVVAVADFTDGGAALGVDEAELAGRHLEGRLTILDRHQLE